MAVLWTRVLSFLLFILLFHYFVLESMEIPLPYAIGLTISITSYWNQIVFLNSNLRLSEVANSIGIIASHIAPESNRKAAMKIEN